MKTAIAAITALCCLFGFAKPVTAHRLDEYLQATRISVGVQRIILQIDLTPGVDIAPLIIGSINTNHDGRISDTEGQAYARQVLKDIALEVDGTARRLTLDAAQFPSFQLMNDGEGTIRIHASTAWTDSPGKHSLYFQNNHKTDLAEFLVNPTVPESRDIQITDQQRDTRQRSLRMAFAVESRRQK